jgi:leader peptidase (prepilin peptidase) / N-methyltransferase
MGIVVAVAVAGLLIGSFLTVVIDRVPRGASIAQPGSACGSCGLRLGPLDLVPVFSWIALRGRCRRCQAWIGWEPIIVELVTAGAFVAFALKFDPLWTIAAHCVLGAALVAQTVIDLHTKRLPREVTYASIAIGFPLLVVASLVADEPRRIAMAVGGAALATAIMGLIHLASRGGMGDGDVRFAPLLGMYLGWQNPGIVPFGLFAGFIAGAVVGVALIIIGRGGRKTALPFGPFMALGAFIAVFAGQWMVDVVLAR